ncbi:MAG: hypothetical protein A2992_04000 [Elusimicrobia bacterium RIFCSPLOWO2_01_FULL_59_12]|nr:MAG: hypothetical protein A2992_04000 [Elusimicrobia bacterium RIFCSPLOWO2_01_FULL_59_12]
MRRIQLIEARKISYPAWTRILLVLLLFETALLAYVVRLPESEIILRTEVSKNYSLLIDDERFPILSGGNQKLVIQLFGQPGNSQPLPRNRVKILHTPEQRAMAKLNASRFRFFYNTPRELRTLREREGLDALRGETDWDTVRNTLLWTRRQFEPGRPRVYRTTNALELLPALRAGKESGFCAHYCYVLVQSLQALGLYARHVTIQGHEVAEAWVPSLGKWVCLDPNHGAYFADSKGTPLSAYQIALDPLRTKVISPYKIGPDVRTWFTLIAVWLRNDLVTHPINIYDLNRYRCRLVRDVKEVKTIDIDDLYTFFPEDLYQAPA